jgi:hypothetical protein
VLKNKMVEDKKTRANIRKNIEKVNVPFYKWICPICETVIKKSDKKTVVARAVTHMLANH